MCKSLFVCLFVCAQGNAAYERAPALFLPPHVAHLDLKPSVHLSVSTSTSGSEVVDALPEHMLQRYTWTHVVAVLSAVMVDGAFLVMLCCV